MFDKDPKTPMSSWSRTFMYQFLTLHLLQAKPIWAVFIIESLDFQEGFLQLKLAWWSEIEEAVD